MRDAGSRIKVALGGIRGEGAVGGLERWEGEVKRPAGVWCGGWRLMCEC